MAYHFDDSGSGSRSGGQEKTKGGEAEACFSRRRDCQKKNTGPTYSIRSMMQSAPCLGMAAIMSYFVRTAYSCHSPEASLLITYVCSATIGRDSSTSTKSYLAA